ncbi:MAG: hypothetical protein M0Z77_10520 [Thermoplasmatales archaeon]|jgi:hypothetical protein|nr:hypothetical protein [Candidatus Thermoplasmatota archaeon]MDA8056061.1 hypothetical protein [Thermoplasmatales archaeon]
MDSLEDKIVHRKIGRNTNLTVKEILDMVEEVRKQYPEREVFFDGDEFAICSRKKRKQAFTV